LSWEKVKVSAFADVVGGGTPSTKEPAYWNGEVPWITPKDLSNYQFRYIDKGERNISKLGLEKSAAKLLPANTVLLTTRAPIGYVAIAAVPLCTNQGFKNLICDPKKALPEFVYYLLKNYREVLISYATGATFPELSAEKLKNIELPLPPLKIQEKIASILSCYDDLIENNIRRIKILEEMVQNLYQEWFIKFRFPGHEKVKMVKSELGMIPEGWEVKKVSDIAEIFRGKSYKSSDIANDNEGLPFLNLKCIERDGGFRYDGIKWFKGKYQDTHTAVAGDIVMAVTDMTQERLIVARAARVPKTSYEKYIFSMDLVKIVPAKDVRREYLYSVFRFSSFPDIVKQLANGANVLHLNPEHIANFKMLYAPIEIQNKYSDICRDIFNECDILAMKNDNLSRTRDLLLPKLISGDLNVENLDTDVGGIS